MRKDESGISGWCKHTGNEFGDPSKKSRRIINRRVRINVKRAIQKELKERENENER